MPDKIKPKIENAPGLVLKERKQGWEARWQARTDLVERGYTPKSSRVCLVGNEPTAIERAFITDRCRILQDEMLVWGRGGLPTVAAYDGSILSLSRCYQSDKDSNFHKLEYRSRENYAGLLRRIEADCGDNKVGDLRARYVLRLHELWLGPEYHVAMAHSLMGMLRTLSTFGATILDAEDCRRLKTMLGDMRFQMAKPRGERMTVKQVEDVRAKAIELGRSSLARAQAFQFECILRQKDVIGEWLPLAEPGVSDVVHKNEKWLKGLRWEEIDENLVLHHLTSKRKKMIEPDLKLAPMVLDDLQRDYPGSVIVKDGQVVQVNRSLLPVSGPVIVFERTAVPYHSHQFRKEWRLIATGAGVPLHLQNMDSRASAISEASDAGIPMEHIRQASTHSNISTTERYSRNAAGKTASVQRGRVESRNKSKA